MKSQFDFTTAVGFADAFITVSEHYEESWGDMSPLYFHKPLVTERFISWLRENEPKWYSIGDVENSEPARMFTTPFLAFPGIINILGAIEEAVCEKCEEEMADAFYKAAPEILGRFAIFDKESGDEFKSCVLKYVEEVNEEDDDDDDDAMPLWYRP